MSFITLRFGLPWWLSCKQPALLGAGDAGSIPGSDGAPEGRNGNPLQCSCLGNPRDIDAWQGTVHRVAEADMA